MPQLTLIDKAFLLKKTALFGHLDLDLLLAVADKMTVVEYERGESIFQKGQTGHRMYVTVEGGVSIRNGTNTSLAELGTHDFFGDESLFNEQARSYGAVSTAKSLLLSLSRSDLLAIINETPSVAVALLHAYTSFTEFRQRHG